MKAIALSFIFKGISDEEFKNLSAQIWALAPRTDEEQIILIHGNMPRKIVEEKGLDTKLCDLLDDLFPIQLNMYYGKTLREEMAAIAYSLDAEVYIIGEVKDHVEKEVALYAEANCIIKYM